LKEGSIALFWGIEVESTLGVDQKMTRIPRGSMWGKTGSISMNTGWVLPLLVGFSYLATICERRATQQRARLRMGKEPIVEGKLRKKNGENEGLCHLCRRTAHAQLGEDTRTSDNKKNIFHSI